MSLFGALRMGGAAVEANRLALQVAGNNISNAGTPGYVRQDTLFVPTTPTRFGNLAVGNGVSVEGITRKIDTFLTERARQASSVFEASQARSSFLQRAENVFNELTGNDLSSVMESFYGSMQDVANDPNNLSLRSLAIERGAVVASTIRSIRTGLDNISKDISQEIRLTADDINRSLNAVRDLNGQIGALEAGTNTEAGSLRTARDQELEKIGSKIDIRVTENPNGTINIYTRDGSTPLLFNGTIQEVAARQEPVNDVLVDTLVIRDSGFPVPTTGGRLGGAQQARDEDLRSVTDALDALTTTFIFEFNKLHSSGQGLGKFTEVTSTDRVLDPAATLTSPDAGLDFLPNNGSFELRITDPVTGQNNTSVIAIDLDGIGADDSLNSVVGKINAAFGTAAASVTPAGQLQINAPAGSEFTFANDTSGFLAAIGINTFFQGNNSLNIAVDSNLRGNPNRLAASTGGTAGDVTNILALGGFGDRKLADLGGLSFNEFYTGLVTDLGSFSREATVEAGIRESSMAALAAESLSISGVSLDEETIKLLSFQRSFQASARFINTVNELLEEVINIGR